MTETIPILSPTEIQDELLAAFRRETLKAFEMLITVNHHHTLNDFAKDVAERCWDVLLEHSNIAQKDWWKANRKAETVILP